MSHPNGIIRVTNLKITRQKKGDSNEYQSRKKILKNRQKTY